MTKRANLRRKPPAVRSRQAILEILKQEGPTDSETLSSRLRISAMAVRQHLYALRSEKLVTYLEQPRPIGRPAKLWSLTHQADRLFPNAHAGLTVSLLHATNQTFGEEGLNRVVAKCAQQQIDTYRQRIPARASLLRRLEALVSVRNEEGYMAEIQRQEDGSFLLIENHCPISAAASACHKLCEAELEVFKSVLGDGVAVERTEHIMAGARRCVYRIRGL